jgi:hypothetical protein
MLMPGQVVLLAMLPRSEMSMCGPAVMQLFGTPVVLVVRPIVIALRHDL